MSAATQAISLKETMPEFFLNKDLKAAAKNIGRSEARFIVDYYYTIQENRKASDNQIRSLLESSEPHQLLDWLTAGSHKLEDQLKRVLDVYTDNNRVGEWSKSVVGIGPVIAAGLLAYIDINQAPTFGHILRFAGMDPTIEWLGKERASQLVKEMVAGSHATPDEIIAIATKTNRKVDRLMAQLKGNLTKTELTKVLARRPWNSNLKTLCWKIGESFVKTYGVDGSQYGPVYLQRRVYEDAKNGKGDYADQAIAKLAKFKIGKDTDAYKWYAGFYPGEAIQQLAGVSDQNKRAQLLKKMELGEGKGVQMLPPAHIHARAKRNAVRLFIAHWHWVAYEVAFNKKPPNPFPFEHLGHTDLIKPPNWEPIK